MNLNCFTKWKITFSLSGYITFPNVVKIHEFEFMKKENSVLATTIIEFKNIEEAQNIAKEKIDELLCVISAMLKQKITAELKEVQPIITCGVHGQAISYLNCKMKVNQVFPSDKIEEIKKLYDMSLIDDNVKKVVTLLSKAYPRTWENLYKIYEVINRDTNIERKGWATSKELRTFKQTANDPNVLGIIDARHGHTSATAPNNPMGINDAIALIEKITDDWIEYKKN